MKKLLWIIATITLLGAVLGCGLTSRSVPQQLGMEKVVFQPAVPEIWTLPNGLRVFYMFDDEIPTISGELYVPGGALFDPPSLPGLANATGEQIRDGGVAGVDPERTNAYLDSIGAKIESSFGDEYGTIGFSCLEDDIEPVFKLFGRFLRQPGFNEQKFALWKNLSRDRILRRKDNPNVMASMLFSDLIYGKGNAWSRSTTQASLQKMTRGHLLDFHRRFVVPNKAIFAISGSVPRDKIKALIDKELGALKPSKKLNLELPKPGPQAKPGVYIIKRDFAQAVILSGDWGPSRHKKILYPLSLYNRVFGAGDFGSTLFSDIRTRLGLAYSVYGGFIPGAKIGVFQMGAGTRSEQAAAALRRMYELAAESARIEPDAAKFLEAKAAVERSFVFKFAKVDSVVERAALQALLGYSPDHDRNYLANIAKVTSADTLSAAKKWVHPEKFVTALVGRVSPADISQAFKGKVAVYEVEFDTEPRIVRQWKDSTSKTAQPKK